MFHYDFNTTHWKLFSCCNERVMSLAVIQVVKVLSHLSGGKEKKVQVGKDQEKAQSEKDSHSKNQGGKKPN